MSSNACNEFKVLSPTAILGYGFPIESFQRGLDRNPDLIAVDAGSTDPGPYYLGAGVSFTDRSAVKRDLRHMIKAGVARKIPVVIGTAGGCGAKPHLDWCKEIIEEIAREEKINFTLGIIPADIDKQIIKQKLANNKIVPLEYVHKLTDELVDSSVNIVAQMGTEPISIALQEKCDVILTGRCYDPAVFAALPIMKGFDKALSLHCGKILECAAIAATPGSGSDCALGTITADGFILEPLSDKREFTSYSAAAHTLYEKTDPYHLPGPGGRLNLEGCKFTELAGGRVKVSGTTFEPTDEYFVKLEGCKLTGYRTISIAGLRDPIMIASIDEILQQVKDQVQVTLDEENIQGEIVTHLYGNDGVMGALEPVKNPKGHERCLIIEAIAPTQQQANTVCGLFRSTLLHYGYEGRIATAGNLAFPYSPSDVKMGEMFEFSLYHLMQVDDPTELFPLTKIEL